MIEKDKLYGALRQMGKSQLKKQYRGQWTSERPTTGYCYVVSEVDYYYFAPKGSRPYVIRTGDNETHWFIKDPEGKIRDFTADQFDEPLDYNIGKPCPFQSKQISKRGKLLAELLGLA